MKKIKIYTERFHEKLISRDVVYEWEDDFVIYFKSELYPMPYTREHPFAALPRRFNLFRSIPYKKCEDVKLFICMNSYLLKFVCWADYNVIPIILDPYEKELDDIYVLTKKLPFFYMTCLDLCERMKLRYPDSRVKYIPQCVAMKYCKGVVPKKEIDAIQFGRRDPLLHEYMLNYCNQHKEVNYVYREKKSNGEFGYISTFDYEIPFPETRREFVALLSKCRISLLSTPLMDKSRDFGDNVDFFTARWYESPAMGCYAVGRYTENKESQLINIPLICENITSYDQFEKKITFCLKNELTDIDSATKEYLSRNCTYARARQIENDLQELL